MGGWIFINDIISETLAQWQPYFKAQTASSSAAGVISRAVPGAFPHGEAV